MSVATAAYSTMSLHAQNDCSLLPNVRNIAVLRANFLGDLVFALPALDALRKAYPDARITLLGKKLHQSFFETRPGPVDEVVLLPPTQGVSEGEEHENNSAELERFFGVMRLRRFDLAIQLHGVDDIRTRFFYSSVPGSLQD